MALATAQPTAAKPRKRPRKNTELIRRRLLEGLSPNDLARETGISGNAIRMYEAGFLPEPRNQFKIAARLGCTTLDLWPLNIQVKR